jgi:hypothetical protein
VLTYALKNVVEIFGGIPGVGKTKLIDQLFKSYPDVRKIYLALSHQQIEEREDFLTQIALTHWYGMPLTCPLVETEPIQTFLDINMPTRWVCRICQSLKLYAEEACPHKAQFRNPANTVIAPVAYLFTEHVEKYNPEIVVVDDIINSEHELPSRNEMGTYVRTLYQLGFCDYRTIGDLFDSQNEFLKLYVLDTIEPKINAGIKRLLGEGSDFSKESAKILLQIDPYTLLDWYRLVNVYGWQEQFSIPLLTKTFELSLAEKRRVIVVGANISQPFVEMLVRNFQREYGEPIKTEYQNLELDQLADSVVYRVRSPKYDYAWYPTTTSIVKSRVTRLSIQQRIETVLLDQVDDLTDLSHLTVGIIKPKNAPIGDFLTPLIEGYCKIKSLDFGSLRGSNSLEHCNVLFIIGTYNVNMDDLQKDFIKLFHRKPLSTESVKQHDGGYKYVADAQLENYRSMVEDYEMYQAIHRARPALRQRKIFVFGLIPPAIAEEFTVEDVSFENSEVRRLVGWKDKEKFIVEQIGDGGVFQADLVNAVVAEFGIAKRNAYNRIQKFLEKHNEEFEIVDKNAVGGIVLKYVQNRR